MNNADLVWRLVEMLLKKEDTKKVTENVTNEESNAKEQDKV